MPAETTSFVGRRRELSEVRAALAGARLVTLVGPGGVGKTRLGIRAATDLERGFGDGAWLVELAEICDAGLVTGTVVAALDLRDQAEPEPLQILLSYLCDRELLLILDNCEHVLGAAAELVDHILRAAPGVRVIATSREPLQVPGERVVPVAPLELPAADGDQPLSQVLQNEAVKLFVERATAASGGFALDAANQSAVVALCRRLDGLPLAIELAAVRTRALTAEQILDRLSDRFALLTGGSRVALPRQQTLRMAIDWSHDLLTPAERTFLRRLSVFAGRFTVEDVECVFEVGGRTGGGQAMDLLVALVDKSLVTRDDVAGVACYRLHETMREYAGLQLREAAEVDLLDDAFIECYRTRFIDLRAALLRDIRAGLLGLDPAGHRTLEWLQAVDLEIDNIRSALQKCLALSDWRRGLDLAISIGYYWITRGTTESIRWFDDLLSTAEGSAEIPARAYHFRGWLSILKNDPVTARPWLRRAVESARAAGEVAQVVESLATASIAENMAGDPGAARRLLDEAEAAAPAVDHYPAAIALVEARATHALYQRDLAGAAAASAEGVRLSREVGDPYYLGRMLMHLGLVAMATGDASGARARFVEGLRIASQMDDRLGQSSLVRLLGELATASGRPRLAARLLGAEAALGTAAGIGTTGPIGPDLARTGESVAASLGSAGFKAEYAAGARLSRRAALRLALGEPDAAGAGAVGPIETGPLSKREAEVAALIAEGLGDKQIAARLIISERTVTTHVGNILNKLGFNSRVQIASWMVAADLRPRRDDSTAGRLSSDEGPAAARPGGIPARPVPVSSARAPGP